MKIFFIEVVLPLIPITIISFFLVFSVARLIQNEVISFFVSCSFSVFVVPILIVIFGITGTERIYLKNKITRVLRWK